jgi:hypothetical protein
MPLKKTIEKAEADKRAGKSPSTQAGEFVEAEMKSMEAGNPRIQSRKQAIAIGLSEARRHGLKLPKPPPPKMMRGRGANRGR